jgi:hypothetical protein
MSERELVAKVAYGIAKVVATRFIDDPKTRRLDPIGRVSAIHTMAANMADELHEEAGAAIAAYREIANARVEGDA